MNEMSAEAKLLRNLKDAGFDEDTIQKFLELQKDGRTGEQYRLLSMQKALLLDQVHVSQHMIDCLDYLVYSMKKNQINNSEVLTMNMNFNFNNPTNLIFGSGKLNELGNQKLPGKKALLLISNGKSVKTYGTLDRVQEQLKKSGAEYVVCDNIHENPSKEVVMEAAAVAKENNCDFIVALGGGAVLDSAVAVSAMATNPGDLWDYVNGGTGKGPMSLT